MKKIDQPSQPQANQPAYQNEIKHWRGLEELAQTTEFKEFLHREFPKGASELSEDLNRRDFLKVMGASLAFAGLAGCRRPVEKIVPYVVSPEEIIPGISQNFATTMPWGMNAYGMVVKSHEGRPTKIEGNPLHPSSLGSSSATMQAELLGLYDPDRSRHLQFKGSTKRFEDFVGFWRARAEVLLPLQGQGLAILSPSFASPTMARLKSNLLAKYPRALWAVYDSVSDENILSGVKLASGKDLRPHYDYGQAKVILALDADFLLQESEALAATRGFSQGRKVATGKDEMNRLYVVESGQSITGAGADHRLRLQARQVPAFLAQLILALQEVGVSLPASLVSGLRPYNSINFDKVWLRALAKDLKQAGAKSLVIAGRKQAPVVHALVMAMQDALGSIGKTVNYRPLQDVAAPSLESLSRLVSQMQAGKVSTLVMLGVNPVYDAPADLEFAKALQKVEHTIQAAPYVDETAREVAWHLPLAHFLESWGDARAIQGERSLIQPLIAPLFDGQSVLEILNVLASGLITPGYELVRDTWRAILGSGDFENRWQLLLQDGVERQNTLKPVAVALQSESISRHLSNTPFPLDATTGDELELIFQPAAYLWDGRYANISWLQELPDPVTTLTWDNAALISPALAERLELKNENLVRLNYQGRELDIAVWVVPGQVDNTVILNLGYGRRQVGVVGNKVGFDVQSIRTSKALSHDAGLTLKKIGKRYKLATTQIHGSMEGRPILREGSLAQFREEPEFAKAMQEVPPLISLFQEPKYDEGYQWGMAIDLNACVGCGACTIACQSENNIPVVGKKEVQRGREMHWIRVDRYFSGSPEEAQMAYQPVACQHCENAPCEQVCPVAATTHDSEGLNVMTYNRCIGTRYCSNNCPYKVRRFNFLNYTNATPEVVKMAMNPDVTVRFRGVMEKCTFCVQRLSGAKLTAKKEGRVVRDGEIQTACQQACPAEAISFGNIRDDQSQVSQAKKNQRNYELLAELNTKPRTSYLAKLRNFNPEIAPKRR